MATQVTDNLTSKRYMFLDDMDKGRLTEAITNLRGALRLIESKARASKVEVTEGSQIWDLIGTLGGEVANINEVIMGSGEGPLA